MSSIKKLVPSSVLMPEDDKESYVGGLEVFHQIHCLDLVRKMTFFDYYREKEPEKFTNPIMRHHTGRLLVRCDETRELN